MMETSKTHGFSTSLKGWGFYSLENSKTGNLQKINRICCITPRIPGHPQVQRFSPLWWLEKLLGLDQSLCSPKHFPHVGQEPVKGKDVLYIFWRGFGCFGESRLPGSLSPSLPSP